MVWLVLMVSLVVSSMSRVGIKFWKSLIIMERKRSQPEEAEFELVNVDALALSGALWSKKDIYDFFAFKL